MHISIGYDDGPEEMQVTGDIGESTNSWNYLETGIASIIGGLLAPFASSEDLTVSEENNETNISVNQGKDVEENDDFSESEVKKFIADPTPTTSIRVSSTPSSNFDSFSSTPDPHRKQDEVARK